MWKTVFRWAVAYTMATQVKRLMGQKVAPQIGHYLSDTGAHLSQNLARDGRRIIGSIVAAAVVALGVVLASMVGMIGFILWAMHQPQREWLFLAAFLLPMGIAVGAFVYVKRQWKNRTLLGDTRLQLQQQWQLFTSNFQ